MGKEFGFGDRAWVERHCQACDLFEEKCDLDADYSGWWARWVAPEEPEPAKPAAVEAVPVKAKPARSRPAEARPPPGPPPPDPRDGVASDGRPLAEYFAAIVARPMDDLPRLAYADAIAERQPDRAAHIRYEVEYFRAHQPTYPGPEPGFGFVAGGSPELRERGERLRDPRDLWGQYIERHARATKSQAGWGFVRGFVGLLRTDPAVLLDPTIDIFNMAPIEHLTLTAVGDVRAALRLPNLAQLRSLEIFGLGLEDADMAELVGEGRLACCEHLDLSNNGIGEAGMAVLLASPRIRAMRRVILGGNPGDPTMQYSWDCHGTIADMFLPDVGKEAERRHGRIDWLHPLDDM